MPDVYAAIAEVDVATQERLAAILELRAADSPAASDPRCLPCGGRVPPERASAGGRLRNGCGHKAAGTPAWRGRSDRRRPSSVFVAEAGELAAGLDNASFEEGDGRALRFGDGGFDVVVCHTVLCHVPEPERVLTEALRVLRPGGTLAVCDGDYATTTVALGEGDPLQDCIEAVKAGFLNDPWLVRRLPALCGRSGSSCLVRAATATCRSTSLRTC